MLARERPLDILALHVHHGLGQHADLWAAHCRAQCDAWASFGAPVRLVIERLDPARRHRGESIEAWARRDRYRALTAMARQADTAVVLLAHHRRDQGETLLLQALRGGGVMGLASMPGDAVRGGIRWRRPWLERSSFEIDRYVQRHRLLHIVDGSNADRRYDRNRLRLDVWPAMVRAFPRTEIALAASARWLQEANDLHAEIASIDLADVTAGNALCIEPWLRLSAARRSNALRAWLRGVHGLPTPATLTMRLLRELPGRRRGRWQVAEGELRLHGGHLDWSATPLLRPRTPRAVLRARADARERQLTVVSPGRYLLPGWGGALLVDAVAADEPGLPLASLAEVELRPRSGGERFRLAANRPSRSLKHQYQAVGVPAWERDGPLLYTGNTLLFVPGLGIDGGRLVGGPFGLRVRLTWARSDPPSGPTEGES